MAEFCLSLVVRLNVQNIILTDVTERSKFNRKIGGNIFNAWSLPDNLKLHVAWEERGTYSQNLCWCVSPVTSVFTCVRRVFDVSGRACQEMSTQSKLHFW